MPNNSSATRLHYELVRSLLERSVCAPTSELRALLGISGAELDRLFEELAALHGVVLHPHTCEPWVVHPFSLTPTLNYIEGERGAWWTPCLWCGFGVATLAGGATRLHTRLGAEVEPIVIDAKDGEPVTRDDLWVHFAVPPAQAWNNVHQHCAMVLPFRSPADISDWSRRHGLPLGEAVPLRQVARLAKLWYGTHADPSWHKWSIAEAQQIFQQAGLVSEFWDLGPKTGEF